MVEVDVDRMCGTKNLLSDKHNEEREPNFERGTKSRR